MKSALILTLSAILMIYMPIGHTQTSGRGVDSPCPGGNCRQVDVTDTSPNRTGTRFIHLLDGGGVGRPSFQTNRGQQDKQKDPKKDPCKEKGNPIIFSTGNKIEPENDFVTSGEDPLYLERTYNHYWLGIGIFGRHWASNFDYIITFDSNLTSSACYPKPGAANCGSLPSQPTVVWAHLPDGRQIKYNWNATVNAWLEEKADAVAKVVKNTDGTYTLTSEDNDVEIYSAYGRILSKKNAAGIGWTFAYSSSNYLTQVTHSSGRLVTFTWTGSQLTRVTDPAGNFYNYTYLANRFGTGLHLLSTSQRPGVPSTTTTYHYEDSRYLGGLTGKSFNGVRYSTFAYDSNQRAILSKHAGDVDTYSFIYTQQLTGEIATTKITNPLGQQTTFSFANGNIGSVSGAATLYCQSAYKESTYDANGYPDLVTDFENGITDYDYNAKGQLLKQTEAAGTPLSRVTEFTWDANKNRPVSTKRVGVAETTISYTIDNLIASVSTADVSSTATAGQTRSTSYTYVRYPNNMLASMTEDGPVPGSGDAVTYNYDTNGNLLTVVDINGAIETYSNFTGNGKPTKVTERNGATTDYVYDARGRTTQVTRTVGGISKTASYTYDVYGNVIQHSNSEVSVSSNFHVNGRMLSSKRIEDVSDPVYTEQFAEKKYTYNLNGNVTQITGNRTTVQEDLSAGDGYQSIITTVDQVYSAFRDFDELGRLRAQRGNANQNYRYSYDKEDRVKVITDSLGHNTSLDYDALGQLIKSTDSNGGIAQFEYDKAGNITKVTDQRGLVTSYTYGGLGQLLSQSSPDTYTTTFTYDAYGRRISMKRFDNLTTLYTYDNMGRVNYIKAARASGGFESQSMIYDTCTLGLGRICTLSDTNGSTSYTYNSQGMIATQSNIISGTTYTTSWLYDPYGRVTQITYPNGNLVNYAYSNGRLASITSVINGTVQTVAENFKYQPMGPLAGFNFGNGLARLHNYDSDLRLTSVSTPGVQGLTFTYNANDNISGINNTRGTAFSKTFGYDGLSRLTTTNKSDGSSESYSYDAVGNRIDQNVDGTYTALAYSNTSNRLEASSNSATFRLWTYSDNGNVTGFSGVDGIAVGYNYDAFNRIVASSRAGLTTSYQINALGQRALKNGPYGETRFIYGPDGSILAELSSTQWTNYIRIGAVPIAMQKNAALYYIHTDQLARPELVTNQAKAIVWSAKNEAFDRTVLFDSIGGLNLGLPGQYFDQETKTWYNYYRDYDPSIGRYVQSDPIGLKGGMNTFGYVNGNPVNSFDNLGLVTPCESKAMAALLTKYSSGPAVAPSDITTDSTQTRGLGHNDNSGGPIVFHTNPSQPEQYWGSVMDRGMTGAFVITGFHENVHRGQGIFDHAIDAIRENVTGGASSAAADQADIDMSNSNADLNKEFNDAVIKCRCQH